MKTVLITGGSKGLGKALVQKYATKKYQVILNYHSSLKEAQEIKSEIKKQYNQDIYLIKCNISSEEEVKEMVKKLITKFVKIDILINNAALAIDEDIITKSAQTFKRVVNTNLLGTFLVSKYVGLEMQKNQNGVIINVSSTNAIDSYTPYSIDYDASKAGIISLTHNLAQIFAPYVRVNAVAPGWINTASVLKMNPHYLKSEQEKILLKRFAKASEIVNLIYFMTSDKASYLNDSVIKIDGGRKC